jgi:hypothetical protein
MKMLEKDFNQLLEKYVEGEDIILTNARGFWETAPKMKCLIMNIGLHILLKNEDLISLKNKLQDTKSNEDKFYLIQEFCADMSISDSNLIKTIVEKLN